MKSGFSSISLLFVLFLSISCSKNNLKKELTGKWSLIESPGSAIEFTSDNKYRFLIGDMDVSLSMSGEEGWKYALAEKNDSTFIMVTDKSDSLIYKGYPKIKNDTLFLTFFEPVGATGNFLRKTGIYMKVKK